MRIPGTASKDYIGILQLSYSHIYSRIPLNVASKNKRTPPGIAAAFIGCFGVPGTVYFPCRVSM
jgi:hypothetical protein